LDKGKVDVARIVVDRAATAKSARGVYAVSAAEAVIYFSAEVLVFSADYGVSAAPKHEYRRIPFVQEVIFCSQVAVYVGMFGGNQYQDSG
jgi:hypothetical protein